jgi:hypothetical protein
MSWQISLRYANHRSLQLGTDLHLNRVCSFLSLSGRRRKTFLRFVPRTNRMFMRLFLTELGDLHPSHPLDRYRVYHHQVEKIK